MACPNPRLYLFSFVVVRLAGACSVDTAERNTPSRPLDETLTLESALPSAPHRERRQDADSAVGLAPAVMQQPVLPARARRCRRRISVPLWSRSTASNMRTTPTTRCSASPSSRSPPSASMSIPAPRPAPSGRRTGTGERALQTAGQFDEFAGREAGVRIRHDRRHRADLGTLPLRGRRGRLWPAVARRQLHRHVHLRRRARTGARGNDPFGYRGEFLQLVNLSASL